MHLPCKNLQIIDKAKRLVGAANVDLALDLIDYDPQLENAMRFVFGSTLVCTDIEVAAKVSCNKLIN